MLSTLKLKSSATFKKKKTLARTLDSRQNMSSTLKLKNSGGGGWTGGRVGGWEGNEYLMPRPHLPFSDSRLFVRLLLF